MSMPKYAARRDDNEGDLIKIAGRLGWTLWKMNEPADWLALRLGKWHVVEIKNPESFGQQDEFTAKQKIFHSDVNARNGKILIWRTEADVYRDSGARVSA